MISWLEKVKKILHLDRKKTAESLELEFSSDEEHPRWWGTFAIAEEQSRYFKISNIVICLDRYNQEWHITSYLDHTHTEIEPKNKAKYPFKSFAAQTSNEIALKPILPDRPLLVQLDRSFYIPPAESLLLYFSSPIWVQVETLHPSMLLEEIPTEILSDTWFGINTLEGELCYANRVTCSSNIEEIPKDTTRVITPISIVNRSKETLLLKELKLPMPYLSIYVNAENRLFTETLVVNKESDYLTISITKGPPKIENVNPLHFLSPARHTLKSGFIDLLSSFKWK